MSLETIVYLAVSVVGGWLVRHYNLGGFVPVSTPAAPAGPGGLTVDLLEKLLGGLVRELLSGESPQVAPDPLSPAVPPAVPTPAQPAAPETPGGFLLDGLKKLLADRVLSRLKGGPVSK